MEKLGWYEFKAEGLSLERLLNQCVQQGIQLRGVKKASARAITGRVEASDLAKLQEMAESRGWRLTVVRPRGMVRLSRLAKQRALLTAGVLAFMAICWAAISCVWFIDVRGAGPYTGEVERILREHDAGVGRFSFMIDTDGIRSDMERQLTGLAWVGVHTSGVRLTVTCVQAQLAKSASSVPGDLVATRDGVIATITVTAGTPKVKAGDVVKRGQLLVRGEERAWNGAVTPIRAEASVTARVWYTAEAAVSGALLKSTPTGETFVRRTLCCPYYELALDGVPAYSDYDLAETVFPIAGPFPVWLRQERYEAVTREPEERGEEAVREEAGLAATRLAGEKVETGVSVIDKWVEYSMMDDGGCRATAVLEAIVEIAAAPDSI